MDAKAGIAMLFATYFCKKHIEKGSCMMLYPILHGWLEDKEGGEVFTCFTLWHWAYIIFVLAAVVTVILTLRGKKQAVKNRVLSVLTLIPFTLYMADFFLMPLAYGIIDVDKLPFHACTCMSILCFASTHAPFLKKFRVHFALLGFISNLIYVAYPSGVMAYEISPLSYRVVQTMLFHSCMMISCLAVLIFDRSPLQIKHCYRDLCVLGGMTVWASLGNVFYSGEVGDYNHDFNWFFVRQDPLNVIPENIAPYVSPLVNIAAFFAIEMIIYLIFWAIRRKKAEN